jgi:hypothetical protein
MIHCAPALHSRLVRWHRRYPARRSRLECHRLVLKLRRPDLRSRISNSALRYRDPLLHPRGLVLYRAPRLRRQPHRWPGRILARRRGSRRQEGADRC